MKQAMRVLVASVAALALVLGGTALADVVDGDVVDGGDDTWYAEVGDELDITVNLWLVRKGKNKVAQSVTWQTPQLGNSGQGSCDWLTVPLPSPSSIAAPAGWSNAADGTTAGPSVSTISGTVPVAAAGKVCQVHFVGTGENVGGNDSDRYTAYVVIADLPPAPETPANNAPEIDTLGLSHASACTVTATVAWSDADAGDTHSVVFDWGYGDGEGNPVAQTIDPATSSASASHTYGSAGTFVVTATVSDGTDSDSDSASFTTKNTASGVLAPFKPGEDSNFKRGSTIPVKIELTDCGGNAVDSASPVVVLTYLGSGIGGEITTVSSSAADSGNTMRWSADGGHYIFNLSTKRSQFNNGNDLAAGNYRLTIGGMDTLQPVTKRFELVR